MLKDESKREALPVTPEDRSEYVRRMYARGRFFNEAGHTAINTGSYDADPEMQVIAARRSKMLSSPSEKPDTADSGEVFCREIAQVDIDAANQLAEVCEADWLGGGGYFASHVAMAFARHRLAALSPPAQAEASTLPGEVGPELIARVKHVANATGKDRWKIANLTGYDWRRILAVLEAAPPATPAVESGEENARLRDALERCRALVQQHNHRQNEKVEDVVHIVNRALGESQA